MNCIKTMNDPILKEKESVEVDPATETPYKKGLYVLGYSDEQIEELGAFFNEVFEKMRHAHSMQVTRNGLTFFQGAIFALGSKELGNVEWKEHCASSIREVFHEWWGNGKEFNSDFRDFFPKSPSADTTETYKNLKLAYQYFSGIAHHNASGIIGSLSALKKDQSLKLEDCYTDDIFLGTLKTHFADLNKLIEYSRLT